jgi:hypothetical protein
LLPLKDCDRPLCLWSSEFDALVVKFAPLVVLLVAFESLLKCWRRSLAALAIRVEELLSTLGRDEEEFVELLEIFSSSFLLLLLLSVAKLALEALDLSVAKKPRFLDEIFSFEALILKKQLFFTQGTFYSNIISSSSKMIEALFFSIRLLSK